MEYLLLLLLGLAVGAFGTLIGAGGGFVLMPILLLVYPDQTPAALTAISLAVVFLNATSGSCSYFRMKRVDLTSGLLFLSTGIPGVVAGALLVHGMPRQAFDLLFGLLLLAGGLVLFVRTFGNDKPKLATKAAFTRTLANPDGTTQSYAYSPALGLTLSFAVGLVSSLLGIGGGIIHVPIMVNLLNFPVHIATATSHFILAVMALTGTVIHVFDGSLGWGAAPRLLTIGMGAVAGAQIGARLSTRMHGHWILRSLAVALGLVGVRILILALAHKPV
ncbi:MAG: sulfite exporter TauE/SafE family protein [Planctomycetes bacterium]|jgi:hypothetical protein|nr:sulfite exporter TauE/SafE family protein [Planctomycetota bacterium]